MLFLPFVGFSLADDLLDKEPTLCDFLHFFWIPITLELLTPFVNHCKYLSWGGLVTLEKKVLLAPVRDVPIVKSTLHFSDSHHLPLLHLGHLGSVLLLTIAIGPHTDLVLGLLSHLFCRSSNRAVVGVGLGVDKLQEDVEVVSCLE